jgi:hypothetical protein
MWLIFPTISVPPVPKLYALSGTVLLLWLAEYRVWLTASAKRNCVNYRRHSEISLLALALCASTQAEQVKWLAPTPQSTNSLGTLTASGKVLLSPTIHGNAGALVSKDVRWDDANRQLQITYAMGQALVHVTVTINYREDAFEATVDADQPQITSVDIGPWSPALQARSIPIPYYTGNVVYLPAMGSYGNAWWDWHTTHATRLSGTSAQYFNRTDATLPPFHEQLLLVLSPDVDAALPSPENPASPYIAQLSGRMVLDIWTPDFNQIAQGLNELKSYGITDCAAIIHTWQHAGYDNALPQHDPANEAMGGDAGLRAAVNAGKANGCMVALHENYVDYYPNYPKFDPTAIALKSDGQRMPSWLNHATGIQSYSAKPAWMVKNASAQSPEIHTRYGTTAAYLDVNSSAAPSAHGDMDAHVPGAGMLTTWLSGDTNLWSYERKAHQGPVFGEGKNHWYYSGLLDGVEAQFGTGAIPEHTGAAAPLFVDFDLERVHPLEVNHGMGYTERWVASGEPISKTINMDAYRMQEIAFGHAPFLDRQHWNDLAHAFVEGNLVTPVAKSYGAVPVSSIAYQVGNVWTTPSVAARTATFSRVQVIYSNGLTVVANGSKQPLQWQDMVLPQYGWEAKGKGLLAYTALCGHTICDFAQTPGSVFANARNPADLVNTRAYATPTVASVAQNGERSFAIAINWHVNRAIPSNNRIFVHFVDGTKPGQDIVFQGGATPASGTSQWSPGRVINPAPVSIQVPSSVPDGIYSVRVGLFDPKTGSRVSLGGLDDGTSRYVVGDLTVSSGGARISFNAPANDDRLNSAGDVVNFGPVQTDGMVSIRADGGQWILRPYPRSRDFTVLLQSSKFAMPSSVRAEGGSVAMLKPIAQGLYWKLPLSGAKSYSWAAVNKGE